ncbi:MAG TPA: hypothetical protein VGM27_32845 [Acidobacteriaceae bacterium]
MNPSAINHIALKCRNLSAQEAFFSKHFGFQHSRTFKAGNADEYIMLKLGSVRLELFSAGPAQTVNANGGEQVIGFKHLAFDVPRLEPAIEVEEVKTITSSITCVQRQAFWNRSLNRRSPKPFKQGTTGNRDCRWPVWLPITRASLPICYLLFIVHALR